MKRKPEVGEAVAATAEARRKAYVDAAFRAASDGIAPAEVDRVCRDAGKTPAEFDHLVGRILARRKAKADLAEAARLADEHKAAMQRLETTAAEIKAANERLEQLRRQQLGILSEAGNVSNRLSSLRSKATETLQRTAAPDADWQDVDAVAIDDPCAPAARVMAADAIATWKPGNTATHPGQQFVPARG